MTRPLPCDHIRRHLLCGALLMKRANWSRHKLNPIFLVYFQILYITLLNDNLLERRDNLFKPCVYIEVQQFFNRCSKETRKTAEIKFEFQITLSFVFLKSCAFNLCVENSIILPHIWTKLYKCCP